MGVIGAIIGLLICIAILFVMKYFAVILLTIFVVGILVALIYAIVIAVEDKRLEKVVKATIIRRDPITKTVSEKTGHTNSYGYYYTYHEHYRDVDVIVGYKVMFSVLFEDGKKEYITCREASRTYKKLIHKK